MPHSKTLVRGRIFNPLSRTDWEYFESGALIIDARGRIEAVGEYQALQRMPDITETLDYSESLILPGLIDLHTHLPQFPIRGISAGALLDWLEGYAFPVEKAFSEASYARQLSHTFFNQLKAAGTTTALILSSVHEASTHIAFEAAANAGLRVIMGKVMMDQQVPAGMLEETDASIRASERLAEHWHGQNEDLLRYAFTPRFALSCSQALLEAVGDLAQRFPHSYIHSHLSENPEEIARIEAMYHHQHTYTGIYEKTGCLGPSTIMAHGLHLKPEEIDMLHATQTRIAHCPTSNFFLKSGFFNLPLYWEKGIPFALGSDVGAGPELCMFRVMRAMNDMQLANRLFIQSTEALYYATLAGAEALSLGHETGNLLPGKSADFIVIDPEILASPFFADISITDQLSRLIYLGSEHQVLKTIVRGKEVYSQQAAHPQKQLLQV